MKKEFIQCIRIRIIMHTCKMVYSCFYEKDQKIKIKKFNASITVIDCLLHILSHITWCLRVEHRRPPKTALKKQKNRLRWHPRVHVIIFLGINSWHHSKPLKAYNQWIHYYWWQLLRVWGAKAVHLFSSEFMTTYLSIKNHCTQVAIA